MNTRVLLAAVAGGLSFFLLGWLLYGTLLVDFFRNNAGSVQNLDKTPMELWAIALGNLCSGLLLAMIYDRWAAITTFSAGARAGAWIGLLMALGMDLVMYGTTNISNMAATLVDPFINALMTAFAGGVVGWVLGMRRAV